MRRSGVVRPRTLPRVSTNVYRDRSKRKDLYEQIPSPPDGVKWKPGRGPANKIVTVMYSTPGEYYKLIRDRNTGDVVYYKLKDAAAAATPKEQIDAEPERKKQVRYRENAVCWWVDNGRWFLVKVVKREPKRITITSVTGWDADRQKEWPEGLELEFPAPGQLFKRLRPLKDRTP